MGESAVTWMSGRKGGAEALATQQLFQASKNKNIEEIHTRWRYTQQKILIH